MVLTRQWSEMKNICIICIYIYIYIYMYTWINCSDNKTFYLCFIVERFWYSLSFRMNMYIPTWLVLPTNVITCPRLRLKQMCQLTKAKTEMKREHWTKRWNWSSCTKLALRASWTHGLIAQSVRASERNSVVVGSNLTQANFL